MFLPVDDNGGDLLVHEQEDGEEESGNTGSEVNPPGRVFVCERNQPAANIRTSWLQRRKLREYLGLIQGLPGAFPREICGGELP